MPSTRPSSARRVSSGSSSSSYDVDAMDVDSDDSIIKVYVLQSKMEEQTISHLFSLAENHASLPSKHDENASFMLELCQSVREADVVLTNIHMRRRLERHMPWDLAKQKAIVTPEWLIDSIAKNETLPCGEYAALRDLHDETVKNCPDQDSDSDSSFSNNSIASSPPSTEPEPDTPTVSPPSSSLSYSSHYACTRASPLICPNQQLIKQIEVLHNSRELEGLSTNALAYERAIATLKAYPEPIGRDNMHEIATLPFIGPKLLSQIKDYTSSGIVTESHLISSSLRYRSLSEFTTVYGIGPATARMLWDKGCRTIEHLEAYYEVNAAELETSTHEAKSRRLKEPKSSTPDMSIKVGLALRHEFMQTIPRTEVEEIHRTIMHELERSVQSGCISTIAGGYRRGKSNSNDIDIIITHPEHEKSKGLCNKLVARLQKRDLITHVLHISSGGSGFGTPDAFRVPPRDPLYTALTVFKLPLTESDTSHERLHRRVDLIFTSPDVYWTAVVGWSGSKMFERDLRRWAKEKRGLKFDSSGITRRHDSKAFYPKSELEVFDLLGLDWVDPTLRNA